ncbi:MAG: DUF2505 domain-containing protein [Proteobacteria bacterium]|nr:DUF2505 domain-containing protein [Pseudomonadota bacterium]
MRFDLSQDFPVGLDRLWTALGQRDYVERKYRSLGSSALRLLKFSADAQAIEVGLERQAPVARDELPAWARVFSGKQQALHQHTRWRRTAPGTIAIELEIRAPSLHVAAKGTGSVVEPKPGRSRMTLHFELACSKPALRATVAPLFARQVERALQADHAFTLDYLGAGS